MKRLHVTQCVADELLCIPGKDELLTSISNQMRLQLGEMLVDTVQDMTRPAIVEIHSRQKPTKDFSQEFRLEAVIGELPRVCSKCGTPIKGR